MQVLQGNREVTASALDTQIDSAVITKISSNDLEEAVRTTVGKKMTVPEELKESGNSEEASSGHEFADIKKGRAVLEAEIHQDAAEACRSKYGLELNAVLITSVSYDPTVKAAVEQRMIQERTRVANKYRSEGEGYLQEMQGKVERKKAEIASEASKKVKDIKGEAEGLVKVILAEGYDKKDEKGNTVHVSGYNQAQDYFNLSRSLEVMEKLGTAKTQFVLNKDDPLLKYLKLE
jgi:membrane protease subunit HflC